MKMLRKRKILLACSLVFLSLLLLSACSPAGVISARAGKKITLTLESNPTTGYSWRLARPLDDKIVRLEGSEYVPPETRRVGAGGVEKWTFLALKKGITRISLEYVRPWEKDQPPADEKEFLLRVR